MRKLLSAFIIIIVGIGILSIINVFGTINTDSTSSGAIPAIPAIPGVASAIPAIPPEKAKEIKTESQNIMPGIKDITNISMPPVESSQNIEESIFINPDGHTKITKGTITAVNPDGKILDVKVWGLTVRVDISETAMLSRVCPPVAFMCSPCAPGYQCPPCQPPQTCQVEMEKFNVGDFVNLTGWMADKESIPPIVKAKYIKNISGANTEIQKIKEQIEQLLKRLRELQQQLGIPQTPITQTPKACTQEAKICPDGTSVGRTGPNCEFAPCPSTQTVQ